VPSLRVFRVQPAPVSRKPNFERCFRSLVPMCRFRAGFASLSRFVGFQRRKREGPPGRPAGDFTRSRTSRGDLGQPARYAIIMRGSGTESELGCVERLGRQRCVDAQGLCMGQNLILGDRDHHWSNWFRNTTSSGIRIQCSSSVSRTSLKNRWNFKSSS